MEHIWSVNRKTRTYCACIIKFVGKKKERNTSHNDAAIGGRRMKQAYGASVRRD